MGFLYQDTGMAAGRVEGGLSALEEARKQQGGLAQALQAQYAGTGPSAAQGLLQRGSEEAIKRSAGALASQRGINPALAQRLASQQASEQTQQAAQSGAILKAQESQQALAGLQNVYGTMGQQAVQQYGIGQNDVLTQLASKYAGTQQVNPTYAP